MLKCQEDDDKKVEELEVEVAAEDDAVNDDYDDEFEDVDEEDEDLDPESQE